MGLDTIVDGALHLPWTWNFVRSEPITFPNVAGNSAAYGADPLSLTDFIDTQFDAALSWNDIAWFRSVWNGPIVLKGIQTVEDARLAADAGVDAVALSNHGGRQLDGAPPPLELVGPVAEAVGGRVEIICDGGIRRGSDIVKAVALGARASMAGRAYLYALGAGGERGVDLVLSQLHEGVRRTMALTGATNIDSVTPDLVRWRDQREPLTATQARSGSRAP
jgi:L-lactate dehydrogenase (cytochrome)